MICALHTLKKEYKNKDIYIWNINRDSMGVFMRVAIRQINVRGFVTVQEEYVGKSYMNRPIVSLTQIEADDNSIIIVGDNVPKENVRMLPVNKTIYYSESQAINYDLYQGKNVVYGIGRGADQLCKVLDDEKIDVESFCISELEYNAVHNGKKVRGISEVKGCGYNIIVSVMSNRYREEILERLTDFQGKIYLDFDCIMDEPEELLDFVQDIDLARKENREIYLYSKRNMLANLIEEMLRIYGIEVNGYVYDVEDEEQGIACIKGLDVVNKESLDKEIKVRKRLFIINETIPERIILAREKIEKAGFSIESRDYTSMKWYIHADEWLLSDLQWYNDSLVGKTTLYRQSKLAWKQYGSDGIRILVLGDSTFSETLHTENWISKLYSRLHAEKIKVLIYNAANICDDIVSNILRLLRDGNALQPQIVIDMGE